MKLSSKLRSAAAILATAMLVLLCFAAGTALLANWMTDDDSLPSDIAYTSE